MEDVVEDQELEMKPLEPGGEVDATSVGKDATKYLIQMGGTQHETNGLTSIFDIRRDKEILFKSNTAFSAYVSRGSTREQIRT